MQFRIIDRSGEAQMVLEWPLECSGKAKRRHRFGTKLMAREKRDVKHFSKTPSTLRSAGVLQRLRACARFLFVLWLAAAGCSTQRPAQPVAADITPEPYVRVFTNEPGLIKLQIAVRQFMPDDGKGAAIWLTGVSHIGDSNYYATLQKHLDAQTLVLFEGIGEHQAASNSISHPTATSRSKETHPSSGRDVSSLQSSMAASLGLVFQLEAIDYQRSNFRNSDLTIPELRRLLAGYEAPSEGTAAGQRFEGVLQLMEGGSFWDSIIQIALRFLSISPKLQALGRLVLIDVIGDIQGDLAQLQGLPPEMKQLLEVLLQRRNEKVLSDVKKELPVLGRRGSLAVFYGTGHMPDMEKHLREDLHYRPTAQLWLTAFEVNMTQSGVSEAERNFVHTLIRQQLAQFKTH